MIRSILRILLILLLTISILIAFLTATTAGLRATIGLINLVIPGKLHIKVVQGYLLGPIHLNKIKYQNANEIITIKDLQVYYYIKHIFPLVIEFPKIEIKNFQQFSVSTQQTHYQIENLTVSGQIATSSDPKKTALLLVWRNMFITATPTFNIDLLAGYLHIKGPLNHYQLTGAFSSAGKNFPQGPWQINQANGNLKQIMIGSLTTQVLNGNSLITGSLSWLPQLQWNAIVKAQHINPALTWPMLQSNLNLILSSTGEIHATQYVYDFNLQQLSGNAGPHPILGTGLAHFSNHEYFFKQVLLKTGLAFVAIDGKLSPLQSNLNWTLNIPQLEKLLPNSSGSITGKGQIYGNLNQPTIHANLTLQHLLWNSISIENLSSQLNSGASIMSPANLTINANNLYIMNNKIDHAQILLTNNKNQDQLTINLQGPTTQFQFNAKGSIQQQLWQGQILHLLFTVKNVGSLQLQHPISIIMGKNNIKLQPFCLLSPAGKTCVQQAYYQAVTLNNNKNSSKNLRGSLQLSSDTLALLNNIFPQVKQAQGQLKANFTLSGTQEQPIIKGLATLSNGQLSLPRWGLKIVGLMIKVVGDQDHLDYQLTANSGDGHLQVTGNTQLAQTGFPTKIAVKANHLLIMNNQDGIAHANSDLTLSWLKHNLNIEGNIILLDTTLTPKDLSSTVTLPKEVVFVTPNQSATANLIAIYSRVKIILEKNIHFDYSGLRGEITGSVTVEDHPGGDTIGSGILSIVNATYKAYGQNLNLRQGRLIYTGGPINNPGLDIQAIKKLQIITTNSSASSSNTKSSMGSYSNNEQIVGISVSGTLTSPVARLFSEPAGLSQADILSYLITGRAASQATSQDSANILSALSLLNLRGGNSSVGSQFGSALGLSEFSLSHEEEYSKENNSVVENTSLLLGKMLSPKLIVNYSLGLVEPINTLKIIYKIRNNLSLQSEHGTSANGIDLFYSIQRP